MEADGHVRVVGRVKELYKLANGKYVAPAPLEDTLARSRFIAQAFVYGEQGAQRLSGGARLGQRGEQIWGGRCDDAGAVHVRAS